MLVYRVSKRDIQTKGAATRSRKPVEAACRALTEWAAKPTHDPVTSGPWSAIGALALRVLKREASPLRDAYTVPLA